MDFPVLLVKGTRNYVLFSQLHYNVIQVGV